MVDSKRRDFIKLMAIGAVGATGLLSTSSHAKGRGRVIVIGGGFGGATCASFIRRYDSTIEVTLIEPKAKYITCPFSNTVLGGFNQMDAITHGYDILKEKRGIDVITDKVVEIDVEKRTVKLQKGEKLSYDRLVVAPGIGFRWGAIEGYDEAASEIIPHAWSAGPQTTLLRDQINALPDGGMIVIAVPPAPFRAPPAPYERASLIAHAMSEKKKRAKIMILDAGEKTEKLALFQDEWKRLYPGVIEWVSGSAGGHVQSVDVKQHTVRTRSGNSIKADVINLIPPQRAGEIAQQAGLTDESGWCPVDPRTFQSQRHQDVYVIGDACIAGELPKIGHVANSEAKICAAAIVYSFNGTQMPEPVYTSGIYSLLSPRSAISEAAVYRLENGRIKMVSGGVSPMNSSEALRFKEAQYAFGWYKAITTEVFGA